MPTRSHNGERSLTTSIQREGAANLRHGRRWCRRTPLVLWVGACRGSVRRSFLTRARCLRRQLRRGRDRSRVFGRPRRKIGRRPLGWLGRRGRFETVAVRHARQRVLRREARRGARGVATRRGGRSPAGRAGIALVAGARRGATRGDRARRAVSPRGRSGDPSATHERSAVGLDEAVDGARRDRTVVGAGNEARLPPEHLRVPRG